MIQAIGLTSVPRRRERPRVDDLTFEARPSHVTALVGPKGAGKTTALRLILRLDSGRGVALLRGRPLHQVPHPVREVGVLLGDVPGHPARSARGHLRMLAAVAGVPPERADDLLDLVGLSGLAHEPLGSFSLGMDRRLGVAAALLGDPHTLVLDEPSHGLSPREAGWLHGLLREYADQGGAVLTTGRDPREATRVADRVVTVDEGRLVADQDAAEYAYARLRPRVTVTSPHAERLAALLTREARGSQSAEAGNGTHETPEVVREGGARLSVYGSSCAAVGETAYRNGIVVHRLADEAADVGATLETPLARADGRGTGGTGGAAGAGQARGTGETRGARGTEGVTRTGATPAAEVSTATAQQAEASPPRLPAIPRPGPTAPFRYELHRMFGVGITWYAMGAALLLALLMAVALVAMDSDAYAHQSGHALPLLAGWPPGPAFFLPPAAVAAGLLGALAYGHEFTYPALAPAHTPVPRRPGLFVAKVAVSGATAVVLVAVTAAVNALALSMLFGTSALAIPASAPAPADQGLSLFAVTVGCAWAGLVAAGIFRSTLLGLAAVLAVPMLMAPAVRELFSGASGRAFEGFPSRLEPAYFASWPSAIERWAPAGWRLLTQPVGQAAVLSAFVILCGYLLVGFRGRGRQGPAPAPKPQKRSNTAP